MLPMSVCVKNIDVTKSVVNHSIAINSRLLNYHNTVAHGSLVLGDHNTGILVLCTILV